VDRLAGHGSVASFMGSDDYKRYFENLTADWQEMMQRAVGKQIRKKSG
jgi:hypothetical protein